MVKKLGACIRLLEILDRSGADMGLSDDLFESFVLYQRGIAKEFKLM